MGKSRRVDIGEIGLINDEPAREHFLPGQRSCGEKPQGWVRTVIHENYSGRTQELLPKNSFDCGLIRLKGHVYEDDVKVAGQIT
jgi:hypothetical protein